MAGRKKAELLAGTRAGMSVARAERLAARAGQERSKGPLVFGALGVAVVAALAGYGLIEGPTEAAVSAAVTPVPNLTTVTEPAVASANTSRTSPAPKVDLVVATVESAAPAVAALVPADGSNLAPATCLDRIEGMVDDLNAADVLDRTWAKQQAGVTELVQTALDCDGAGFRVAGSLELLGTGLADLKVEWRPEDRILALAMIDRSEADALDVGTAPDGKTIQFVIR